MDLGLDKKNILIVGASKGIGRGIAIGFAEEHCNIVAIARSAELLEEVKIVKEILEKYNKEVNIYDVDSLLEVNEDNIENIVLKK